MLLQLLTPPVPASFSYADCIPASAAGEETGLSGQRVYLSFVAGRLAASFCIRQEAVVKAALYIMHRGVTVEAAHFCLPCHCLHLCSQHEGVCHSLHGRLDCVWRSEQCLCQNIHKSRIPFVYQFLYLLPACRIISSMQRPTFNLTKLCLQMFQHCFQFMVANLKYLTGPTSENISVSISSVTPYGMLPTVRWHFDLDMQVTWTGR